MEENYQGYNQPEYENDDPRKGANKSILGYRIVIIILAVILAAITVLYYNIHRQQQADYDLLVIDRDSIQNNLSDLMQDFDDLQLSNDTLSLQMGIERQRADSLMQRLKQERSWSLAKIKQYEKEVGTLRTIMRGYLHQIDSLNTLNKKLIDENVSYRKEITTAQMRAEMAEEKAQELNNKVRQGSVINARGIRMVALNARSKEVSRIKNAERLRVDFTLTANALATPGEKTIYVLTAFSWLRSASVLRRGSASETGGKRCSSRSMCRRFQARRSFSWIRFLRQQEPSPQRHLMCRNRMRSCPQRLVLTCRTSCCIPCRDMPTRLGLRIIGVLLSGV